MSNRAIVGILLAASAVLSEPCNAQRRQFGTIDGTVFGNNITVLMQDVCSYPFFVQATAAKPLKPGEAVALATCEMYRCTNHDLRDQCPSLKESFKVMCKEGTATLEKNGSSVTIKFKYPKEKYKGHPVCQQWEAKDASESISMAIQLGPQPQSPTPTPAQSSNQGSVLGDKIRCGVLGSIYRPDIGREMHPECQ
jgi:hypothetical protein